MFPRGSSSHRCLVRQNISDDDTFLCEISAAGLILASMCSGSKSLRFLALAVPKGNRELAVRSPVSRIPSAKESKAAALSLSWWGRGGKARAVASGTATASASLPASVIGSHIYGTRVYYPGMAFLDRGVAQYVTTAYLGCKIQALFVARPQQPLPRFARSQALEQTKTAPLCIYYGSRWRKGYCTQRSYYPALCENALAGDKFITQCSTSPTS